MRDPRPLTDQANTLLSQRYLKNGEGWYDLCERVSSFAATSVQEANIFYNLLSSRIFLPNTPCLANAGTNNPQVAACFLLPIDDTLDSIFKTLADAAKIYQSGGGVGINFSALRPTGFPLSRGGSSGGPISFMRIFNEMTEQVKQGSMRRGAGIGLLSVEHPSIVEFIKCKNVEGQLSNFNISVMITDKFMAALANTPNDMWITSFNGKECWLEKDNTNQAYDGKWWHTSYIPREHDVNAYTVQDIWNLICAQAWKNGEPGLLFIDTARRTDPNVGGCNPCGEVIMEPDEACILGSIDVSRFVNEDKTFDWTEFKRVAQESALFLNRMIDKGTFPLQQITDKVRANRRIGLGIMGLADAFILMGIQYGLPKSLEIADSIAASLTEAARETEQQYGFKNRSTTCIAPTGSLSIITGCSSGCEPVFAWSTKQTRADFGEQIVYHPLYEEWVKTEREFMPDYFVTSSEIPIKQHILMQAALQDRIEGSISKTINMPNEATPGDVQEAYQLAYNSGCKGITIYRDGSRQVQVLSNNNKELEREDEDNSTIDDDENYWEAFLSEMGLPKERPYCLEGFTFKIKLDLGGNLENTYVTVTTVDSKPYEVFVYGNVRDADQIIAQYIDTVCRLISLSLRSGAPLELVITQLRKVPCSHIFSIPHRVADVLQEFVVGDSPEQTSNIQEKETPKQALARSVSQAIKTPPDICPICNKVGTLTRLEGCLSCSSCGWSKCS